MKHVKDHHMLEDGRPSYLISIFEGHTVDGVTYSGEFKIYTIVGDQHGVTQLRRAGGNSDLDCVPATEIANAEVLIHGSVKSGGCSNWWIENGDAAIHHCSGDDLRGLFAAITFAHTLAAAVPTVGHALESWGT